MPDTLPMVSPRVGAASAVTGTTVWIGLFVAGVLLYPGYSMAGNWISDLGHPAAPAPWTLNAGSIIAGALFVAYGLALGRALGDPAGRVAGVLVPAAGLALVSVGLFPEESPYSLHTIASLAFFLILTTAAAVLALPLYRSERFGALSGGLSFAVVASAVALIASWPFGAYVAIAKLAEHATVFAALAWSSWNAIRLSTVPRT